MSDVTYFVMYTIDQLPNGVLDWNTADNVVVIIHMLLALIGLLGHGLILVSLVGYRVNSNLILTISLVLSDCIFMGIALYADVYNLISGGYAGGKLMCLTQAMLILLGCFGSVFAILSTTLERYLHIIHQKEVTTGQALLWVLMMWIGSVVFSWFPLFFSAQETTYGLNSGLVVCVIAWWSSRGTNGWFTMFTAMAVLITYLFCSSIMIYCYYRIVGTYITIARGVRKSTDEQQIGTMAISNMWGKTVDAHSSVSSYPDQAMDRKPLGKSAKKDLTLSQQERLLLTKAIILTVTFFVMWTPYLLKVLLNNQMLMGIITNQPVPKIFDQIALLGAIGNSFMNSILLIRLDFRIQSRIKSLLRLSNK
jgi:hypothetical protein